jgi:hypothetical protein
MIPPGRGHDWVKRRPVDRLPVQPSSAYFVTDATDEDLRLAFGPGAGRCGSSTWYVIRQDCGRGFSGGLLAIGDAHRGAVWTTHGVSREYAERILRVLGEPEGEETWQTIDPGQPIDGEPVDGFYGWKLRVVLTEEEACNLANCVVCGGGPLGRCSPPDDYEGDCPHGCSPER